MPSRPLLARRPSTLVAAVLVVASVACGPQAPTVDREEAGAAVVERDAPSDPVEETPPAAEDRTDPIDAAADLASVADQVEVDEAPPEVPELPARVVWESNWAIFATVDAIVLQHPAAMVERIGFHESNHAGAQQLEVFEHAIEPVTLDTRGRGTGSRSAADVVVEPDGAIRAPVTGTVLRAGTYVLYCDHRDDYVVIEPDARPGWEVKLLHIDGVRVTTGDRVEAGVTVLAPRPTPLPFASQVDELTAEPSWPHVHIEVVDPSIPNPPSSGSSC
jgi:biotin carboxyl carrier protein